MLSRFGPKKLFRAIPAVFPPFAAWRVIDAARFAIEQGLAGKPVVILGGRKVGKSSLTRLLEDGDIDAMEDGGRTSPRKLTSGNDRVRAENFAIQNIPGTGGLGYPTWKAAFLKADHVWYLFHSDLIAGGDDSEIAAVKEHLDMFKDWMNSNKSSRPRIILVGTFADRDPSYDHDPAVFRGAVAEAQSIAVGRVKLDNADVIVGSIASKREAVKLIKALRNRLDDNRLKRSIRTWFRKFGEKHG